MEFASGCEQAFEHLFPSHSVLQEGISFEVNKQKIGKAYRVIVDREEEDFYVGRTEFDSPEVDPEVLIRKERELMPGNFYNVTIDAAQPFELYGTVTD